MLLSVRSLDLSPFYSTVHVIFAALLRHGLWRPGVIVSSKKNLLPQGDNTFLYAEAKRARVSSMPCRRLPYFTVPCRPVPDP
jgi:hypothetical protein